MPEPTAPRPQAALLSVVRQVPQQRGVARSRWTLRLLREHCAWLGLHSDAGLWRLLARWAIAWKRGRAWVHSPDPAYDAKQATIAQLRVQVAQDPQLALLDLDEVTLYRQPSVSQAYAPRGHAQALARRSHTADTVTRVVGTLDEATGRVVVRRGRVSLAGLVAFFQQLVAAYPAATRLYLLADNWPVHRHPDVLVALEPQQFPTELPLPRTWPSSPSAAAVKRYGALRLPLQLVWLPTYASWLNPIEKLWRKLRQELMHLHPFAADVEALRREVDAFFAQFAQGSPELLRYVGLTIPK